MSKMLELYYTKKKNKLGNKLGFYIGGDVFDVGLVLTGPLLLMEMQ